MDRYLVYERGRAHWRAGVHEFADGNRMGLGPARCRGGAIFRAEMDRPWSSAATRRIAAVLLKEDAMNIDEEREALRQKMEGLQYLGYVLEKVQAHSKYLSTIPSAELSDIQKLWVLAYESIDLKMAA